MAEGKEHALAIGITKMTAEEIRTVNKVLLFLCSIFFPLSVLSSIFCSHRFHSIIAVWETLF